MTASATMQRPTSGPPRIILAGVVALAIGLIGLSFIGRGGGETSFAAPAASIENTLAFWEGRVANDPTNYVSQNRVADSYLRLWRQDGRIADFSRAEAALEASVASNHVRNYGGLSRLALVRVTQHRFEEGAELASAAIVANASQAYAYGVLGDARRELGQTEAALEAYGEMLARQPGLASYSRLAAFYAFVGDLESADGAWHNAITFAGEARPEDSAWAWTEYGRFLMESAKQDDARAAFQRAIEAQPSHGPARASLATIEAANGDPGAALVIFESLAATGQRPEYSIGLGELRELLGDDAGAMEAYRRAETRILEYRAAGIRSELLLAKLYGEHNFNLQDGLAAGSLAYERRPGPETGAAYAWSLHQSGRSAEASAILTPIVESGVANAATTAKAGFVALALGENDKAADLLTTAVQTNPAFSILLAAEARATLERMQ